MPIGLIALALGEFGIGALLPEVAADSHVIDAAAGWLISGYTLSVVVGALLLSAPDTRLPRKPVLGALLVLFTAGNLLSAVAPGYLVMMPRGALRHIAGAKRRLPLDVLGDHRIRQHHSAVALLRRWAADGNVDEMLLVVLSALTMECQG